MSIKSLCSLFVIDIGWHIDGRQPLTPVNTHPGEAALGPELPTARAFPLRGPWGCRQRRPVGMTARAVAQRDITLPGGPGRAVAELGETMAALFGATPRSFATSLRQPSLWRRRRAGHAFWLFGSETRRPPAAQ